MLSEADGALDPTGSCRTNRAAEQADLDKILDGAISERWRPENEGRTSSSGGLMVITRRSGRGPYGVVVSPMPSPPFGLAAAHVAAVLLISDPDVTPGPSATSSAAFIDCRKRNCTRRQDCRRAAARCGSKGDRN